MISGSVADLFLYWCFSSGRTRAKSPFLTSRSSPLSATKGSRKNKFAELALRFGSDLPDPIEQNRRNSELFRGVCARPGAMRQTDWHTLFSVGTGKLAH